MGTVLKSSLFNLTATLVSLLAGFAVSILNARLLGPEGSGLAAFALWFATSASALTDRGMPQTMLRSLGLQKDDPLNAWKATTRTAFSLFIRPVFAAALATAGYGLWTTWDSGTERGLFWAAALLLFLCYTLFAFTIATARGRGNFREVAVNTVTGSLLQLPFIVAGAHFLGAAGAIAGMAVRFVPQLFNIRRYVDLSLRPDPARLTPEMRRYARQMWLSDLIDVVIMTRAELALLGLFFSAADMGYFAAAAVFAGLIGQSALQLSPALIVGFATSEDTGDARARLFDNAMRLTALGIFPVAFGGAAIIQQLLPLAFGATFSPAGPAAAILLLASAVTGIAIVPWAFLAATGGSGSLLRIMTGSGVVTVALLTTAIAVAGLNGAAVARMVSECVTLALLILAIRRQSNFAIPYVPLLKTAVAAVACGSLAHFAAETLTGWLGIAVGITGGALAYLIGLRFLRLVPDRDILMLLGSNVVQRLPNRIRSALATALHLLAFKT